MSATTPVALDYRCTARRPEWTELPEPVRAAVCDEVGEVGNVAVAGGGFTPAFAATVTTTRGDRVFLKAADLGTDFGEAIQREAVVLDALPGGLPVPDLRWSTTVAGWVVSCLEVIDGYMPGQPWTSSDLEAVLAAQAVLADALTVPTARLRAAANERSFAEHADQFLDTWRRVRDGSQPVPDAPWVAGHHAELAALETGVSAATAEAAGLMHLDLRPDNALIMNGGGRAVVLDWNWVRRGPGWVDTVMLLTTASGEHDVDRLVADHPTTAGVAPDLVDAVLAALGGALLEAGDRPLVPTSPFLRVHQRGQGLRAVSWLAHRRGWAAS